MVTESAPEFSDELTVRLRDDVARRLREVAARRGTSADEIANEFLAERLDEDEWFHAAAEEGRAAIARGESHSWDEVRSALAERKAKLRAEHGL